MPTDHIVDGGGEVKAHSEAGSPDWRVWGLTTDPESKEELVFGGRGAGSADEFALR